MRSRTFFAARRFVGDNRAVFDDSRRSTAPRGRSRVVEVHADERSAPFRRNVGNFDAAVFDREVRAARRFHDALNCGSCIVVVNSRHVAQRDVLFFHRAVFIQIDRAVARYRTAEIDVFDEDIHGRIRQRADLHRLIRLNGSPAVRAGDGKTRRRSDRERVGRTRRNNLLAVQIESDRRIQRIARILGDEYGVRRNIPRDDDDVIVRGKVESRLQRFVVNDRAVLAGYVRHIVGNSFFRKHGIAFTVRYESIPVGDVLFFDGDIDATARKGNSFRRGSRTAFGGIVARAVCQFHAARDFDVRILKIDGHVFDGVAVPYILIAVENNALRRRTVFRRRDDFGIFDRHIDAAHFKYDRTEFVLPAGKRRRCERFKRGTVLNDADQPESVLLSTVRSTGLKAIIA